MFFRWAWPPTKICPFWFFVVMSRSMSRRYLRDFLEIKAIDVPRGLLFPKWESQGPDSEQQNCFSCRYLDVLYDVCFMICFGLVPKFGCPNLVEFWADIFVWQIQYWQEYLMNLHLLSKTMEALFLNALKVLKCEMKCGYLKPTLRIHSQ